MMRGLVVVMSLWIFLILAHHGQGQVLPNDMSNLEHEESMEAIGVSIAKENHHGATHQPMPCTWVCGKGENHNYECNCVPNASKKDEVVEVEKAIGAHKPLPCTWVCGEGENHNYECNCVLNAPKKVEVVEVEKAIGAHKPVPCTWVCGEGENHNYECNCVANAPMVDEFMGAPVNALVGGHH